MRINPLLPALLLLIVLPLQASGRMKISFYPPVFTKGELGIVRITDTDPSRDLSFITRTPGKIVYKVHEASRDVSFIIAIPLAAGSRMGYSVVLDGKTIYTNSLRIAPKNLKVYNLQVEEKFTSPPKSIWARLDREGELLGSAKAHFTNIRFFGNCPTFPLASTNLSSSFGETRKVNRSQHYPGPPRATPRDR